MIQSSVLNANGSTLATGVPQAGVLIFNASLTVQSSTINVVSANSATNVYGIALTNGSSLTLNNSSLNFTNTGSFSPFTMAAVYANNSSMAVINNSSVSANGVNLPMYGLQTPVVGDNSLIVMNGGSLTTVNGISTFSSILGNVVRNDVSCTVNTIGFFSCP